jgi:hypothetical protein
MIAKKQSSCMPCVPTSLRISKVILNNNQRTTKGTQAAAEQSMMTKSDEKCLMAPPTLFIKLPFVGNSSAYGSYWMQLRQTP